MPTRADRPLVIYGAGGHGQVVAEAARAAGMRVVGFVDDAPPAETVAGLPVLSLDHPDAAGAAFHVAVGDNATRQAILRRLSEQGRALCGVTHPTAFVSDSATIGEGVFVGPLAVVHTQARLGDGVIVNSGAVVEHHNDIGACVHVAPGAVLGGGVTAGERALIGLGARVLPGVTIGRDATVGAGAVVTAGVGDGETIAGVPARPIRRRAS